MLIHHFGAETLGIQGLVDINDQGKIQVFKKSHILKNDFRGVPALTPIDFEGEAYPIQIVHEIIFVFDVPCISPNLTSFGQNISKYVEIYLATILQGVVQITR